MLIADGMKMLPPVFISRNVYTCQDCCDLFFEAAYGLARGEASVCFMSSYFGCAIS